MVALANFCGVNAPTLWLILGTNSKPQFVGWRKDAQSAGTSWKEPAPVPTGYRPNSAHRLVLFGQETVGPHSVFKNSNKLTTFKLMIFFFLKK